NEAMGHDPKERVGRLGEGLEVIERLWNGEPVTYQGTHFRLRDVRISMRPLQRPRPPIWLAANSDAGVRRAARLGDAWLMNPHATLPTLERQVALFRRTRTELGRPTAIETPLIKECYVAPESSAAFAEAAPFLDAKYRAYRRWEQDRALPAGESFPGSFEELARDRFVLGDPVRVAEEIARYRERLGVTTLIFRIQWPGMDQAQVLRSIRLLGTKVLPKVTPWRSLRDHRVVRQRSAPGHQARDRHGDEGEVRFVPVPPAGGELPIEEEAVLPVHLGDL